jgi:hypothetical protein
VEKSDQGGCHENAQLFSGTNHADNSVVNTGEVSAVLYRIVRCHYAGRNCQDYPNVTSGLKEGTSHTHEDCERNLVQVVVQQLSEGTAIISASRLLSINSINRLIPKKAEPRKEPHPWWQNTLKRNAKISYRYELADWHDQTHNGQRIGRKTVRQQVVSYKGPKGVKNVDLERCKPVGLVPIGFNILKSVSTQFNAH